MVEGRRAAYVVCHSIGACPCFRSVRTGLFDLFSMGQCGLCTSRHKPLNGVRFAFAGIVRDLEGNGLLEVLDLAPMSFY